MSDCCDCCTGITVAVPQSEANPPGAAALRYRVGDYATFLETMLARLSTLTLAAPSSSGAGTDTLRPLAKLTTRDPADPSIALLDAWAIVADVLTFYQERIANEGYLPTARERRSVLELARLIGYRARPGVAASVKLAFTAATGFAGTVPAGVRAQSVPAAGQLPQFFETSAAGEMRDLWNALAPRLHRPQLITPAATDKDGVPLVTGADVIDSVYLDGNATNVKAGDPLFFIFGPEANPGLKPPQQYLRLAADVAVQAKQNRTEVTLQLIASGALPAASELQLYANKADYLFAGSSLAAEVKAVLNAVVANITASSPQDWGAVLAPAIARIQLKRDTAEARGFYRIGAWLAMLLRAMQRISLGGAAGFTASRGKNSPELQSLPAAVPTGSLERLGAIVQRLSVPSSVQPANALRLVRPVAQSFTPQSDAAPRLLAALNPVAASSLYAAWSAAAIPAGRVEVHAARAKASLFAANWPGAAIVTQGVQPQFDPPSIQNAWSTDLTGSGSEALRQLPLDTTYEAVKPGSWIAADRPEFVGGKVTGGRIVTFHLVVSLRTTALATGTRGSQIVGIAAPPAPLVNAGFAAKVTVLTLSPPWLSEVAQADIGTLLGAPQILRDTTVYVQSEKLGLTDEPLDTDVGQDTLDLAQVYDGLEPGRFVIVSGTRTDIPDVSGVPASELAMIAGVAQGSQAPLSVPFPLSSPPFASVAYTTDSNAFGDRLVVGTLADPSGRQLSGLAAPVILNQQYSDQVELAPGLYASAYVPDADELAGKFPAFTGLLLDPETRQPFPGGVISDTLLKAGLRAWRTSSEALHTILTFAAPLAYQYDRATVQVYGNVADATQGQTTGEVLGSGDASQAFPSFALSQWPLTYVPAPTPSGAESTLTVRVNELEWHELDDLAAADQAARVFVTAEDEAGKTSIIFGNGVHGARVPTGTANVKATYRYGLGKAGNVAAGQISQLATRPLGLQGVINPLPASGGADADTLDQARANAPLAVAALDRLVSVRDYADFARTYAGIGKAVSTRLSDGRQQLVHVTISGAEDAPILPTSDLYGSLLTSLQKYGDPHLPVMLALASVKLLVLQAGIALLPDYAWEDVAPRVQAALLAVFAYDARSLGQTAYRSEAVLAAQAVDGVAYVDVVVFDGVPDSITAAELAALGSTLRSRPYVQAELARPDPGAGLTPPVAILPARLVFMTPDLPATLSLTQIGG